MKRLLAGIAVTITSAAITLTSPAAHAAESPVYMKPMILEQAVLRAQPGTQLGDWTQNFYFRNTTTDSASELRPDVCPSMTRKPITLPKADSYGAVGYEISQDRFMSITIWQYRTAAQARAALTQFEQLSCPDSPRVPWEDQKFYPAQGGSDFSESKVNGVRAYIGGYSGTFDGVPIQSTYAVRVVGLSVVKVEVDLGNDAASGALAEAAESLANSWVDAASRAVMKFSGIDPQAS